MKQKMIAVQTANGIKLTQAPPPPTFTPEEIASIQAAARATWDYIGSDVLSATGKDMPRAHVIEVVLDANRLDQHLLCKELLARFYRLPYAARIKLVKPAFPYAKYGY
jgi:hypothetical protein